MLMEGAGWQPVSAVKGKRSKYKAHLLFDVDLCVAAFMGLSSK